MAFKKFGEGSPADKREDRKGAKKAGMSFKAYERSPADRKADKKAGKKPKKK